MFRFRSAVLICCERKILFWLKKNKLKSMDYKSDEKKRGAHPDQKANFAVRSLTQAAGLV
jgi:hypothetical protein